MPFVVESLCTRLSNLVAFGFSVHPKLVISCFSLPSLGEGDISGTLPSNNTKYSGFFGGLRDNAHNGFHKSIPESCFDTT